MQELVSYILKGLVSHPDDLTVQVLDGETSVLVEVGVAPEDRERLSKDESRLLKSLRAVANAASGRKQAVIELLGADEDVGTAQEE